MSLSVIIEFLADNWKIMTIPVIAALVGYLTNVIAVKMTFYPLELWGFRIGRLAIGWQGIIPGKAPKMADIAVDLMTTKLISIEDVILQIDPHEMAEEMRPHMIAMTEKVMSETLDEADLAVWESLPQAVRDRIYSRVARELPHLIQDMITEISENIHDLFDLKEMVVEALMNDKQLMVDIFLKCGIEEFRFIERSGAYFGFLFGLLQMTIWVACSFFFPTQPWINLILPVFGGVVGYATNWLALKLIFRPVEPMRFLGLRLQGLFIKRQEEVSAEYARIVAGQIINSRNIFHEMVFGKHVDRLVRLAQAHVKRALDVSAGYTMPFIQFIVGPRKYKFLKRKLVKRFVYALPGPVKKTFDYTEKALDIENLVRTRLQALPPEEFEGILRPAFQEEELKLILVGMALGVLAGTAQLVLIFGGDLAGLLP